jgi:hypothetical protein
MISGSAPNILIRDQVAINRVMGGVEHKFQIYALEDATFEFTLRLRNFELRQLHLLGMIVSAIPSVAIGSGKGKGFGLFTCAYQSGTLRYFGRRPDQPRVVRGLGEDPVWGPDVRAHYEIEEREPPLLPAAPDPFWVEENAYRFAHPVSEEAFRGLWQDIGLDFARIPTLEQSRQAPAR